MKGKEKSERLRNVQAQHMANRRLDRRAQQARDTDHD